MPDSIGVIGAGSFGTSLGKLLADKGLPVHLWVHDGAKCADMIEHKENRTYLPGVTLPFNLMPTTDLAEAVSGKILVLLVVPSHAFREVATRVAEQIDGDPAIVTGTKGVEDDTAKTMAGVLEDVLPERLHRRIAAFSGPTFAKEIAQGIPGAVTVASRDEDTAKLVQQTFTTHVFRVYTSNDLVGVEIGGAAKNVIAIAAGVSDGLGFGHNTRAALITRGLAEIARLATKLGADRHTLAGLAGMGDLVLTCTGDLSRNRTVGLRLGRGETLEQILGDMKMVAEGVRNAKSIRALARAEGVDMPITEQMYLCLHEGKTARQAVIDLMAREVKAESY